MRYIYNNILASIQTKQRLLAVLLDPDKVSLEKLPRFIEKLNHSMVSYIFVGGSEVTDEVTDILVAKLKRLTKLPIIIFPGDVSQITEKADALLFLSLISGRNPEYLIHKHVKAASILKASDLEVIPTGYILIENGKETSVQRVTKTRPMSRDNINQVVDTAFAGQLLGQKLIYLEAGSGATHPVSLDMISEVKKVLEIPLIVGGGIRSKQQIDDAFNSGADLVVIGTAFEENESFFSEIG